MAEEIKKTVILGVQLDPSDANANLNALQQKFNELSNVDPSKPFKTLKAELQEATRFAAEIGRQFGTNSQEFALAAQRVAEIRDRQGELNASFEAFNPDNKLQSLVSLAKGATGAVQGITGAMTFLGVESENAQAAIARLQGLMAFSDALNSVDDIKNAFSNFNNVIQNSTVFQKLNAAATTTTSVAIKALGISTTTTSTAFNVLKGAIVATGIGALVIGLVALVQNFDSVKKAVLNLIPGLSSVASFIGNIIQKVTDFVGVTSEAERAADKLYDSAKKRSDDAKLFLDTEGDKYDEYTKRKIKANADYYAKEVELRELLKKGEIKNQEEFATLLAKYREKANREILSADKDRQDRIKADQDKANEDAAKKNKELEDKKTQQAKERLEKVRALEDELNDYLFKRFNTTLDIELREIQKWYDEKYKIAKGNADLEEALAIARAKKEQEAFQKAAPPETIDTERIVELPEVKTKIEGSRLVSAELKKAATIDNATLAKSTQDKISFFKLEADERTEIAQNVANALGQLGTIIGQQTVAGKALAVAQATVDTYAGANKALAQGGIFGFIGAAAVIAAGIRNISKIVSTKVPAKTGDNVSSTGSAPNVGTAPIINAQSALQQQIQDVRVTNLNNQPVRAFIVDRDLDNNQQKKNFLNNVSSF